MNKHEYNSELLIQLTLTSRILTTWRRQPVQPLVPTWRQKLPLVTWHLADRMPSLSLPGATPAAAGQGVTPQPATPPCLTRGAPSFHPIATVLPLLTPGVSHKPTREALDYSTVRANATRSTIRRRCEDKLISSHWVRTAVLWGFFLRMIHISKHCAKS